MTVDVTMFASEHTELDTTILGLQKNNSEKDLTAHYT